jgi:tetratricopeptide (TPR) repeat protein
MARLTPLSRFGVGRSYAKEGRFDKAEEFFEPLLDIEAIEADVSPGTLAEMLNEIGDCAMALGKREKAVGIWQKALSLVRLTPSTGQMLFKVAVAELVSGRLASALACFARAFKAAWEVSAADPLVPARMMIRAAAQLRAAGAFAPAGQFLCGASEALAQLGPPYSAEVKGACFELIGVASACDLYALACDVSGRLLTVLEAEPAPPEAEIARVLLGRASVEISDGRYGDAARTLDALDARPPLVNPEEATALRLNADGCRMVICSYSGDHEAAEAWAQRAYERTRGAGIELHQHVAALNNLAFALLRQRRRVEEAARLVDEARTLVAGKATESFVLSTVGLLHHVRGEFEAAEQALSRSLGLCEQRSDRPAWAEDAMTLAECYLDAGRNADARRTLAAAERVVGDVWSAQHPRRLRLIELARRAAQDRS